MLRNDKIEWIWNYVKEAKHNDLDIETLNSESNEFLDIVIEEICEYEDWNVHGLNKYKAW